MQQLLEASADWVNLPYTFLFIVVMLYWLSVIAGVLDMELFHHDVDAHVDGDFDVDGGGHFFHAFMAFFNPGAIPVMVIVSIAVVAMWAISMTVTYQFGFNAWWIGLLLIVPNVLVSFTIAKYVSWPLRTVFKKLDEDSIDHVAVRGNLCRIRSVEVSTRMGQAEVDVHHANLLINVRTNGGETLARGDEAVVVDYLPEEDCYLVSGVEKPD